MKRETFNVAVRVDEFLDGSSIRYGVPVNFRPVINDDARRFDGSREIVTTIAPVSADDGVGAWVQLARGAYDVEAVLPSGDLLRKELFVESEAQAPYDPPIFVVLSGDSSPNECRNWARFASVTGRARYSAGPEERAFSQKPPLQVTIGRIALSEMRGFDSSSWRDWFEFLEEHYHFGSGNEGIKLHDDDSGLFADIDGRDDGALLCIKFVQRQFPSYFDPVDVGRKRAFAAIAGETATRLFALPWPWYDDAYSEEFVPFEMLATEEDTYLRCDLVLRDWKWAGLFAYLNRGRVDLAAEILTNARNALFGKFKNPLAAAVGGYVLLSSVRGIEDDSWPQWLHNLALRFPYLPDGPILRARWLLARDPEKHIDEVHALLRESVERGLPFFTTGVVWLIEGLERTSLLCPHCVELLRVIRGVALSMNLNQAFTSFSIAKPRARNVDRSPAESDAPADSIREEVWGQALRESALLATR